MIVSLCVWEFVEHLKKSPLNEVLHSKKPRLDAVYCVAWVVDKAQ